MKISGTRQSYSGLDGKYLTFRLGNEEYGFGIMKIREIIGLMPITSVPQSPEFVKGVINLRGKIIPVVDLRLRFSMKEVIHDARTCIIVLDISGESRNIMIGVIVDSVSEVLTIREEDIEETPSFGASINTDYILGMAKSGGCVKILVDMDRVLDDNEIRAVQGI